MTTIAQLTAATVLSTGDQVPLYSTEGGDTMRASLALLLAFMQANLTLPTADLQQQFAAPSATGFTVTITSGDTWLILTPVAGYAAGTITLPANPLDGERVQVNSTQAVTTLTVGGNGQTVTGAPATLAANAFFTMAYSATLASWYRVG